MSLHHKPSPPVESTAETGNECATQEETLELQANLAAGDFTAFWQLWEMHERYLYRVCLRHLGTPADAEDALGRLLIKLWESLPRHAARINNLRAWLTRSAVNLCVDIHRERRQARHGGCIENLDSSGDRRLLHAIETPEENAMREEIKHSLCRGVTNLKPELRIPFLLHVLHEIPYGEVAEQLAISPETARKRGQLAREFLRDSLTHEAAETTRSWPAPTTNVDLYSLLEESLDDEAALFRSQNSSAKTVSLRLVDVVLNSGIERSFYIHLDHKPRKLAPKIESMTRYTNEHPSGWKKRLELAQLLYEAGQWKRAIEEYRRVLAKQPQLIDVYLELGNLLDLMDDESESIETYQKALAVAHAPATRHRIRGLMELRRRHYHRAIAEFQEATRLEPQMLVHWRHLAFSYLLGDSPLEALGCFEQVLSINANDSASLTYVPYLLRDLGRTAAAETYLQRALTSGVENILSLKYLIDSRAKRGWVFGREGLKTRALLREALTSAPQSPEVQESLAGFHLGRGEWNEAIALLQAFTKQRPLCLEGWVYYATLLFQTGVLNEAVAAIKQALRLDPNVWQANLAACEIFSWGAATDESRQVLETMLEKFSRRWRAWTATGLAWILAFKDAERAIAVSARAPQFQPRLPAAWFQHSQVLALAGKCREAIMAAEVGWKHLPDDEDGSLSVPAAIRLAENYVVIMANERKQFWIDEAWRRLPAFSDRNAPEASYWRGKLFELIDDQSAARKSYRKALDHHLLYPLRHHAEQALLRLGTPLPGRAAQFPVGKRH